MNDAQNGTFTRQRNFIMALLVVLAAAAWIVLIRWAAGMGMNAMSPTMGLGAPLFLVLWVVMMVAMMFPAAAPMILLFHRVQSARRQQGAAAVATWIFIAGYLAVWAASGVVVYLLALAAEALTRRSGLAPETVARIGGGLIVAAGLYQFTPLKNVCLAHCRTPTAFIMTSWRDGPRGALGMGWKHGLYCLGCCWFLFAILFPLGIMNIAAMAVVTVVIVAEKTFPLGPEIAKAVAVLLIAYGAVVFAMPRTLPTFMPAAVTGMPGMSMPAK